MLFAEYCQPCWLCPRCYDHVPGVQCVTAHLDRSLIYEMGSTVKRGDPGSGKSLLRAFRNRFRERSFETHQGRPVDLDALRCDPIPIHAIIPVNDLCGAYQHLFGISTPQGAGASEWPRIDDCDVPPRGTAPISCRRGCGAGPYNDKIKFLSHSMPPCSNPEIVPSQTTLVPRSRSRF